jgi:cytochrome b6-f complex iron-sulfur subunit
MAEKKKMSVAEILAAARKADSKADGGNGQNEPPAAAPAEPQAAQPASPAAAGKAAAPAATPGKKLSTAEILAAARANKAAAEKPPVAAAEKPAPKPAPKPAAKAPATEKAAPATTAEKDTASILAAARAANKPGPISKAEAAVLAKSPAPMPGAAAEPKAKKSAIIVPPMPAKPAYAQKKPAKTAEEAETRRGFLSLVFGSFLGIGFFSLGLFSGLWSLGIARFMFPNILTEPPSNFKVGFPADFPPGAVSEKFKAQFGVWVVNGEYNGQPQIYALKTVCTHLGCTPNWLEAEQKFKCPCHGSGFYKDGINFEGPAPRPLERYAIRLADDGQLEIDKSKTFQEEMGAWSDPSSFVPV